MADTSWEKSCRGKTRHDCLDYAIKALRGHGQTTGDLGLVAYRCRHCGYWHLGHPKRSEQRRLATQRLLRLIEKANERRP